MKVLRSLIYILLIFLFFGCSDISDKNFKKVSKIIFLSNREAPSREFDIFLMNPDGSNQTNITTDIDLINTLSNPQLSPDGKSILYLSSNREKDLRLINIENRTSTTLTRANYDNAKAVFSPKGDKILFLSKINSKKQINIINIDGTELKTLSNPKFEEYDASFSSDGSKIVFISKGNGNYNLSVMNIDATERKTLVQQKGKLSKPTFSPNNDEIAFVNYIDNVPRLSIISSDGGNIENILSGKVVDSKIYFTPDAKRLVFNSRDRGGKYSDVSIIDIDGEQFINLTDSLNYINQNTLLTPDGKSIIFNSIRVDNSEIYRVDINSGERVNLTNNPNWDQYPNF
ncbi:MAG: hypothetical protein L3J41_08835 [Melioribacteraceae bacterium]|nr:hypothetical protein [Melioribacteraceae bacterium]